MSNTNTSSNNQQFYEPLYPLENSELDILTIELVKLNAKARKEYILNVLKALKKEIKNNTMSLKSKINFSKEIADYRALLRAPADSFLMTDDVHYKRNVLGVRSYGSTHTNRSRKEMWKMVTKQGSLQELISLEGERLVNQLVDLFDINNKSKSSFRKYGKSALQNIYSHLQMNFSVGASFPPFHARFFADRYLPLSGECIVIDPCAGYGGRLLGILCVQRRDPVHYIGIDPEINNQEAYEQLKFMYDKYLSKEAKSKRTSKVIPLPFEKWIKSSEAKQYMGKTDLVITSPPYFDAELYNSENKEQSANKYKTYEQWKDKFYAKLIQGAFQLLKPKGVFVLNVANVASAKSLERDARSIAKAIGFNFISYYKLALPQAPGTKNKSAHLVKVNGSSFKFEPCFCFSKP